MMEHWDTVTTQIYAEVTRTKINEDMTNLAERIGRKYELAGIPVNKGREKKKREVAERVC